MKSFLAHQSVALFLISETPARAFVELGQQVEGDIRGLKALCFSVANVVD